MIEFQKFHKGIGVIKSIAGYQIAMNSELITKTMLSSICQFLRVLKRRVALLAHLSRRLTGELIGNPWSGAGRPSVRRPSVRPFAFSNIPSETAWPIKAKFYVEPPWVGGTKVCSRHLGHMTKMAATPIYGKNPSKSSSPEPADRFPRLGM